MPEDNCDLTSKLYIDDYNKITLINNRKYINYNYNCTSQFSPIFVDIKLTLPLYQVHKTSPIIFCNCFQDLKTVYIYKIL